MRVVDMYCIKPIDAELIEKCAKETGAIVTAEEHSVIGGLGGSSQRGSGKIRMPGTGRDGRHAGSSR